MMKRLFFMLMTLAGTLAVQADDYPYLTFETSDGTKTSVPASSLTITIEGTTLKAGDKTFSLSDLSKMYFSQSDVTAIDALPTTLETGPVEVFTASGITLGQYDSLQTARTALKQGLYIFRINGKTLKVAVK